MSPVDAIELEMFRHALGALVDEMDLAVSRTACSPIVYDYKDYCVGVLTEDFRLLSQSRATLPFFLADLGRPVADAVEVIGEDLGLGDVLLTNAGEVSGQQLNHVVTATPLPAGDGSIAGYLAIRTHWVDVGGQVPGSVSWDTQDLRQEGFQMRGLRVVRRGRVVPEVVATIRANSYMPDPVTGDLEALVATCRLGARRWREDVLPAWTDRDRGDLVAAQFRASAEVGRRGVAALPDGTWSASYRTDDGGAPDTERLTMTVAVTVSGDRMMVDLSELPPQQPTPINTGAEGGAVSAVRLAFKSLVAPDRLADDGLFDALEVVIPPGTVLSAVDGAPMSQWNMTMPSMIDLVLRAVGSVHPDLVPAGHHGTMAGMKVLWPGADGRVHSWSDSLNGGFGAHAAGHGHGPLKTLMHGENYTEALEVTEFRAPVRFVEYRLRRDAGGAGRHRGGPGVTRTFEVLAPVHITTMLDRTEEPPWGLAGGRSGKPGRFELRLPGEDRWRPINKVTRLALPVGALVRQHSAGGGGWGEPEEELP